MVTGNSRNELQKFDSFFTSHLDYLRGEAKAIFKESDDSEDHLIDLYIDLRGKIASGYTFTVQKSGYDRSLRAYMCTSLYNSYIQSKRKRKFNPIFFDINEETIANAANMKLIRDMHNAQPYYDTMEYLVRHLFQFVTMRYGEKRAFLFKIYFLRPECNTYDRLHQLTGYRRYYIERTLRTMKRDVRDNFISYVTEIVKSRSNPQ